MNILDTSEPTAQKPPAQRRRELAAVVAVSLLASLPFANKAFHIDDPLYLSIAQQILVDPVRPFHGMINWQQITEPAWNVSISPPGFSYWLAAWMAVGVTSELGLHLVGCFWTVLLGLATYAWASRLGTWPLAAALIVVANPLVIAGQNLMLDVPMLALATSAMVVYLHARDNNSLGCAVAAGTLAGLAVNVKYAAIVATGVMLFDVLAWRRWRMSAAGLTGLAIFAAGQWATHEIYGEAQIVHAREWIQRLWPSGFNDVVHRKSTAVVYLGASASWLVLISGSVFRRSWKCGLFWLATATFTLIGIADLAGHEFHVSPRSIAHYVVFAANGWVMIVWLIDRIIEGTLEKIWGDRGQNVPTASSASALPHKLMLLVWTAGFFYLGALNGPFVAPRALLPCVVSLVLAIMVLAPRAGEISVMARRGAIVTTMLIGFLVGAGDARWANTYRDAAPWLAEKYGPRDGTVYFLGHWGWQWYADVAGMVQFDPARTRLAPGDVIILPENVDCPLPVERVLRDCVEIARDDVPGSVWLPRTRDPERLVFLHGDTARGRIPWGWAGDDHPQEWFRVYRRR